jgi:acetyltransferase-like isoleucine patch superfamily enzyme
MFLRWDGTKGVNYDLRGCGENVSIAHGVTITDPARVTMGDNVRIDPYVYISGEVEIGSNVHICAGAILGGRAGIRLGDWTFVGYGSKIFTGSEDYTYLVNETWGASNTDVRPVRFMDYSGVASGVIVMPGVILKTGTRIGANTFVHQSPEDDWTVYYGTPMRVAKRVDREATLREAHDLEIDRP